MPEATINEDGDALRRENDVRAAYRCAGMQPVAKPVPPEQSAQESLRAGMAATYARHLLRSR